MLLSLVSNPAYAYLEYKFEELRKAHTQAVLQEIPSTLFDVNAREQRIGAVDALGQVLDMRLREVEQLKTN